MSNLPSYHPPNSLMSPSVLWSIIGHTVISVCGNIGIYIYLQNQEFYSPNLKIGEEAGKLIYLTNNISNFACICLTLL